MRKEMSTKPRARRPSVLHEFPDLGIAAMKAGLFTVGAIAEKVDRNEDVVAAVLRKEKRAEPTERRIAEALGLSVTKLRKICERQTPAVVS